MKLWSRKGKGISLWLLRDEYALITWYGMHTHSQSDVEVGLVMRYTLHHHLPCEGERQGNM